MCNTNDSLVCTFSLLNHHDTQMPLGLMANELSMTCEDTLQHGQKMVIEDSPIKGTVPLPSNHSLDEGK